MFDDSLTWIVSPLARLDSKRCVSEAGQPEYQLPFFRCDDFPFSRRQITQFKAADARAQQPQGRVPDGRRHPAHLAVFAFRQFQINPAIGNVAAEANRRITRRQRRRRLQNPGATWQSLTPPNQDAFFQLPQRLRGRNSLHLRPITATMPVSRMKQPLVQLRFVTEQQQSFAVGIEPADGINVSGKAELRQCPRFRALRCELRNDAVRFVKRDEHQTYTERFAVSTSRLHDFSTSRNSTGAGSSAMGWSWSKNSSQTRKKSARVVARRIWCRNCPVGSTPTPR